MSKQTLKRMIGLLCIAVALTACKEKEEIVDVVRAIKTTTIREQATKQLRKFPAVVAAVDSSDLSFQVGGQVASVAVDIGDRVEKGQILAVLDPEPYQLDVDAVKAELVKARDAVNESKSQYDREQRIYDQGAGVKSRLEVAEYNYKATKSAVDFQVAKLAQAQRNLRKTTLVAPYDGTIALRSVQPNEEVQVGQKIFEIDATGQMEVQLAVPEGTIDQIHIDDAARVTFPTLPGDSAVGRISYIGSAAVKANAFPVKVELVVVDPKVKPGMTAEATLTLAEDNQAAGYTLPIQAILPAAKANWGYAFLFDPNTSTIKKTPIRFHGVEEKKAIAAEGLKPGDIIAVAGVSFLADGMTVKLLEP
jgi:RND family efflux transporter MFP subunit